MGVVCSSLSHMISRLARSPKIGCWTCGGYKTNYKDEVVKFLFPQVEPTAVEFGSQIPRLPARKGSGE